MRYPLDSATADRFLGHIVANDRSQRVMIETLSILLAEAMKDSHDNREAGEDKPEWFEQAVALLKLKNTIHMEHETRIFNEKNGHAEKLSTVPLTPETAKTSYSDTVPSLGLMDLNDPEVAQKLNETEGKFGEELSETDLAKHFGEKSKKNKKDKVDMSKKDPFKGMSLEEIEEWESKQDNSNDIYKVKARIVNLARGSGASLTPVGEMMCNTFVHVVKDLYDFAETIPDKSLRITLIERIRKHESMPGTLINAAGAGVRNNKK